MHLSLELLGICHNVDVLACCDDVSRSFLNMLSDGTTEIQVNLLLFKFSVSKNRSIEVSPVRLLQGARLRSDGAYINQHDDKLIPVQVFSRISEGSTHGKQLRFPARSFSQGPYILSAGNFPVAMCEACFGLIHAERLRFSG